MGFIGKRERRCLSLGEQESTRGTRNKGSKDTLISVGSLIHDWLFYSRLYDSPSKNFEGNCLSIVGGKLGRSSRKEDSATDFTITLPTSRSSVEPRSPVLDVPPYRHVTRFSLDSWTSIRLRVARCGRTCPYTKRNVVTTKSKGH